MENVAKIIKIREKYETLNFDFRYSIEMESLKNTENASEKLVNQVFVD